MYDVAMVQGKNELTEVQAFDIMEGNAGFQIAPYDGRIDLEDTTRFTELALNSRQKMQVSALLQQTPQALAAGTLANAPEHSEGSI